MESGDVLRRIPPRINFHYLATVRGALNLASIVCGIIVAACANKELCKYYDDGDKDCGSASEMGMGGESFLVFVAVTGLIFTFLLLIAYLLEIPDRVFSLPWLSIEIVGQAIYTVLYFIAMAVGSFFANGGLGDAGKVNRFGVRGAWIAAAIFSAFNFLLHGASLIILWWRQRQ